MSLENIKTQAHVPYTPNQMYALVNQIEDYPEFLPACTQTQVTVRTPEQVEGSLFFAVAGFQTSLTTRNHLKENQSITMELVKGPFQHFKGIWYFDALPEQTGCQVSFHLNFELSNNRFINKKILSWIHPMMQRFIHAFVARAHQIYG